MDNAATPEAVRRMVDRGVIREAIENWGLFRDAGRWAELRALYTPDGTMQTTWFDGAAAEFVERSIESHRRGTRVQHFIGSASITLNGEKAIVESRVITLLRTELQGLDVDVTCYARFCDRFVRSGDAWLIKSRVPIYEKDRLDPVDPQAAPALDQGVLARYPEGYRHLAYVQTIAGRPVTPGLHVSNGEALASLYAAANSWLRGS